MLEDKEWELNSGREVRGQIVEDKVIKLFIKKNKIKFRIHNFNINKNVMSLPLVKNTITANIVSKGDYLPALSYPLGTQYLLLNNENERFCSLCLFHVRLRKPHRYLSIIYCCICLPFAVKT